MKTNRMDSNPIGPLVQASLKSRAIATGLALAITLLLPAVCLAEGLLQHPQKIVIDAAHNRLLVSNDNVRGDIVSIDSMGNQDYFVPAAGCIDGMEIAGNTVYGAASGKRIRGYDLDDSTLTMSVTLPGTSYLSSLIADDSGYLYITCPLRNELYKMRLSDGANWTFVGGGALNRPNGLIFQEAENRLVVIEDRANPRIMAVSLADSTVTVLATTTLTGGDGIAQDMAGNYYVTGYYLDGIYKFDPAFAQDPEMIYQGTAIVYPTYDARDNSLLVTCYDTSTWLRIPLDTSGVRSSEASKSLLLHRSSPNPFPHDTTIRFDLGASAHARVDVYDVMGNAVRTLVDEAREAGNHAVMWDGRSSSGMRVPCGAYYFRLSADGVEQTQKAMLIE